jgi:hypothetical protein
LIVAATRWAVISWAALNLFVFVCLIDIMGLGSALVGVGLQCLAGMGVILLAVTIARLTMWVGLDVWNGLCTETESLIHSLNPARWISGRYRGSALWDEWLDEPIPGRFQRWKQIIRR